MTDCVLSILAGLLVFIFGNYELVSVGIEAEFRNTCFQRQYEELSLLKAY